MALNPIAQPYYRRAPRDYPNYQGILGIRGQFNIGGSPSGIAMRIDTPVVIGKVPGGAIITACNLACITAVTGTTTPILDVGLRDPFTGVVTRQALAAAFDVSVAGLGAGAGANLGYQATDQEVVMTLGGTGAPTAGAANVVVSFATRQD